MTPVAAFRPLNNWLGFAIGVLAAIFLAIFLRLLFEEVKTQGLTLQGAVIMTLVFAALIFDVGYGLPAPWLYGVFIDSNRVRIRRPMAASRGFAIDDVDHFETMDPTSGLGQPIFLLLRNGDKVRTSLVAWRYARQVRRLEDALAEARALHEAGR